LGVSDGFRERVVVIVILVVIVFLAIFVGMIVWYRRPPQLSRRLRSTGFSRRRSEAIRQAAAEDVAEILHDDFYTGPAGESESEL
jgi:hypothetical protein